VLSNAYPIALLSCWLNRFFVGKPTADIYKILNYRHFVFSVEPGGGAAAQPGGEQAARPHAQTHRRDCQAALLQQDRGRGQAPDGQDQTSAPEQVRMLLQQDRGRGQAPGGQDQTSSPEQVRTLCCFYYFKCHEINNFFGL
jgi:hypothetical protein